MRLENCEICCFVKRQRDQPTGKQWFEGEVRVKRGKTNHLVPFYWLDLSGFVARSETCQLYCGLSGRDASLLRGEILSDVCQTSGS